MSDRYQNELTGKRRDALWRQIDERRRLELQMVRPVCNDELEADAELRRERWNRDVRQWVASFVGALAAMLLLIVLFGAILWTESCHGETCEVRCIEKRPDVTVTTLEVGDVSGRYELWMLVSFDLKHWNALLRSEIEADGCFAVDVHDWYWNAPTVFWRYELRKVERRENL